MYSVYCIIYIVYCIIILYNVYCITYTVKACNCNVQCLIMYNTNVCSMNKVQYALKIVFVTLHFLSLS